LIRQRARAIKATGKPIFLEWRWEMDRPNLQGQIHSPAEFIAAWDHIRAIFAQQQVRNVAWVWCPTALGFKKGTAQAYYPGNNEVDWVCADAYPGRGAYRSLADTTTAFRAWAAQHRKPIMIGEYGVPRSYTAQQRATWLRKAAQTAQSDPQIKALVYFDSDPLGHGPQLGYALQAGSAALGMFRHLGDQPYFDTRNPPAGGS
jgi:beta-mannanase